MVHPVGVVVYIGFEFPYFIRVDQKIENNGGCAVRTREANATGS